jgi:hypothetical protein
MSRSNPFKDAMADVADEVAFGLGNLLSWALDVTCLLALGLLIYSTGIDTANAGLHGRPIFGVQASIAGRGGAAVNASHAPTSCHMNNDLLASANRSCTHALILRPLDI